MNWIWVLIGILVVIAGIVFIARGLTARSESLQKPQPDPKDPFADVDGAREFSPKSLAPGAIIRHGNTDYVVRGSLEINQGPYVWHEHMVDGGTGTRYFSVEMDEGVLDLVMWEKSSMTTTENPPSETEVDGVHYTEYERGPAHYKSTGNTGLNERGDLSYVDYKGSGVQRTRRLAYEKFGDAPWEMSTGIEMSPGELTVYPAPTS